jgi:hypothetical protein
MNRYTKRTNPLHERNANERTIHANETNEKCKGYQISVNLNDPWSVCLYSSNLGTFWLKIEQFWPFEEISIFSNGGHLGYRTGLTDTILKGDYLRITQTKFG